MKPDVPSVRCTRVLRDVLPVVFQTVPIVRMLLIRS
jgi:hypothetical protein